MKKCRFISMVLSFLICLSLQLPAATEEDSIRVFLNGKELSFDVPPQMVDERTMVPVRAVFEAMGADVYWIDSPDNSQIVFAVKNETKILMAIDQMELITFTGTDFNQFIEYLYYARPIILDVPPTLIDNRALVPLRAVSEAMGVDVGWDEDNRCALLTCPDDFLAAPNIDKEFGPQFEDYLAEAFGEEFEDPKQELFSADDKIQKVIIESSDPADHAVYLLDLADSVETLKNCFSRVSVHMGEGGWAQQNQISFANDFTVRRIPFPDLFSQEQIDLVTSYMTEENKKYQYTFQVKNADDFHKLNERISEGGNIAYLPYSSITGTKPSIQLSYSATAKDKHEWDEAFYKKCAVGEFAYDDYFLPYIEDLKAKGLYFDQSMCRFSGGVGLQFTRMLEIYLTRSLTQEEITQISEISEASCVLSDLQKYHNFSDFLYLEKEEYKIKVLFDREQSQADLKEFCQTYGVDSFDYDKEPLSPEDLTIYYKNGIISDQYQSVCVSEDLKVTVKEYDPVPFTPFKDEDPNFKIVEQRDISDKEFEQIRKIISNYDILQIPDNLGFGGYEFNQYVYIGIHLDGKLHVCGGQDPFSQNDRFNSIYRQILNLLDIEA